MARVTKIHKNVRGKFMDLKVDFETLISAIEKYQDDSNGCGVYIDKETGNTYDLWMEYVDGVPNEEMYREILTNPKKYIRLPNRNDIDENNFIKSLCDNFMDQVLDDSKQGHFKKIINEIDCSDADALKMEFTRKTKELALYDEWIEYQKKYWKDYSERFIIAWCKENNIIVN